VLYVDDEAVNLRIAERLLTKCGVDVLFCDDGDTVLPAILHAQDEGRPVSLVFMDITMKRMNGDVAARLVHDAGFTVPIIAVTGERVRGDRYAGLFQSVIEKPFNLPMFIEAINHWVEAPLLGEGEGSRSTAALMRLASAGPTAQAPSSMAARSVS
jgi:CheY-like chemotaxis protein